MSESKWWKDQRVMGAGNGPGTVDQAPPYQVIVEFDSQPGMYFMFHPDGRRDERDLYPTLFPIDTERPKERVKKRVEGWVIWFVQNNAPQSLSCISFSSIHLATQSAVYNNTHITPLGTPEHVVKEWEE